MPTASSRLSSRQHPVVRAFRALAHDRGDASGVLLDGAHLIREALEARVPVRTVLVSTEFLSSGAPADRAVAAAAARAGATVHEATVPVIDAASPVRSSSGIVAIADWAPCALGVVFDPAPALVLGLVDVQDPGNVGAVIRSADALGATGVVAIDRTANPSGWKALRGAMGSTFRRPVARASLADALVAARRAGARVLAAVAAQSRPVSEADLRRPTLVLLGNEGAGLPAAIIAQADDPITIPMRPGVSSLNVAVTAALIVYEARRQREDAEL